MALGNHRSLNNIEEDIEEKHTCILCSESHAVNLNLEAFVAVAYVQRSTVLSQEDRQAMADHFVKEPAASVKELSHALIGMSKTKISIYLFDIVFIFYFCSTKNL